SRIGYHVEHVPGLASARPADAGALPDAARGWGAEMPGGAPDLVPVMVPLVGLQQGRAKLGQPGAKRRFRHRRVLARARSADSAAVYHAGRAGHAFVPRYAPNPHPGLTAL